METLGYNNAPTELQVLSKIKRLYKNPNRWTKGTFSKQNGKITCYCLSGAITHYYGGNSSDSWPLRNKMAKLVNESYISFFNDRPDTTIDDIRDLIDRAINQIKQEKKNK